MTTERSRRRRDQPTVESVTADLRRRIRGGDFRDESGEPRKLPSGTQLSEEYGLSRQAMVRVIANLKSEGLVHSRKGSGVWPREWEPLVFSPQTEFEETPPGTDIFTSAVHAKMRQGTSRMDEVTVMEAPEPVRTRLALKEGEPVAVRLRTNVVDGEPVHTDDSYVPLRLVKGSEWLSPDTVARGTNRVLAELGHELVVAVDEITAHVTRPEENERLGIGAGNSVPAVQIISTAYDTSGHPVQVTIFVLPTNRNVVVYKRRKHPVPPKEGA